MSSEPLGDLPALYAISATSTVVGGYIEVNVTVYRGSPHNLMSQQLTPFRSPLMQDMGVPAPDQLRFCIRDAMTLLGYQLRA